MDSFCKHIFPLINMYKTIRSGADLVEVCRNAPPPPPPLPSWDIIISINQSNQHVYYSKIYFMFKGLER